MGDAAAIFFAGGLCGFLLGLFLGHALGRDSR
jgi:hypothetical protein